MKSVAKETEAKVVTQYANVEGALPSTVLQEISQNMLSSDFPGQLNSASSSGAIRQKLWR